MNKEEVGNYLRLNYENDNTGKSLAFGQAIYLWGKYGDDIPLLVQHLKEFRVWLRGTTSYPTETRNAARAWVYVIVQEIEKRN